MADEENKIPADDDWLDDLDSEPEFTAPEDGLDTSAFDELFATPKKKKPEEPVVAGTEKAEESVPAAPLTPAATAAPESTAGQEDLGVELDQSSIDSLLNEVEEPPAAAAEAEVALDQSTIDSLFEGGDEPKAEAAGSAVEPESVATAAAAADPAESAPKPEPVTPGKAAPAAVSPAAPQESAADLPAAEDLPPMADIDDPDQAFAEEGDELDELFGSSGDSITLGGAGEDSAQAFVAEEDGGGKEGGGASGGIAGPVTTPPEAESGSGFPDLMADTVLEQTGAKAPGKLTLAGFMADKKILAIAGGVAAALIFVIVALVLRSGSGKVVIPAPAEMAEQSPTAAPQIKPAAPVVVARRVADRGKQPLPPENEVVVAEAETKVNRPPKAVPLQATIPVDRDQVRLLLAGEDQDRDSLNFEVVSLPAHGSLSGDPPELTYIAGSDFSGTDSFAFRVTDPGGVSDPALVEISRAKVSPAGVRIIEPRRPLFRMAAARLETGSTRTLLIDGRKLWQEINSDIPLDRKAVLDIRGRPRHGRLQKVSSLVYKYIPDPYDHGVERFSYRFRNRGFRGKRAILTVEVANGNPPPDVRVAGFSARFFRVGDRVVVDAGPTRDDDRGSLKFRWLQNQGVDVRLERLNAEGSKVSFVVPSYFYTTDYPEPVFTVEARDASGQVGRVKVRIPVRRRRVNKEWDGLHLVRGKPADPGRLLPWSMAAP